MATPDVGFEISTSARGDGTLEAVYIRLARGKVARTVEIVEDIVLADYNSRGRLLGIELLAPVRLPDIANLIDTPRRAGFRKAVRKAAPQEFVLT
ncbi:MAG: DUF2283 domain-containing protein [Phycisphaerae bacterium]|nr:DUF2283 domain-containing protein [Phycisphaerae bacterium]